MARAAATEGPAQPIPLNRIQQSPDNADRNVVLSDPHGEVAEAIYALRARVQSQHLQLGRRALAICGPAPDVGCTFVAVNLAVALSQIGLKVLLIDGDLRGPAVQEYFKPALVGAGLFECLSSPPEPVTEFIHEAVHPGLDVMTAGNPGLAAHELLAGEGFNLLMNACLRDYDITIVDTPPANSCADGMRISTVVGFSLIVARKHMTLISDLRQLASDMSKERVQSIGVALNYY